MGTVVDAPAVVSETEVRVCHYFIYLIPYIYYGFIKPLKHKALQESLTERVLALNLTVTSTSLHIHLVILEWMHRNVVGFMLKELVLFCILPI